VPNAAQKSSLAQGAAAPLKWCSSAGPYLVSTKLRSLLMSQTRGKA